MYPRGIPTRYKGRQYRSRLEARWACFFDLLGWHHEYEPCDFEGWIPDFVLCEAEPVFVEVKPVSTFPEDVAAQIDATSCMQEVLIVGMHLLREKSSYLCVNGIALGWLREVALPSIECEGWKAWDVAALGVWTPTPHARPRVGFCHVIHSFHDRITGQYDGGSHGRLPLDTTNLFRIWAEAGNVTQWKKRH